MSTSVKDYDYLIKIILIGNTYVGKVTLLNRFIENAWIPNQIPLIGVDFIIKYNFIIFISINIIYLEG